MRALFALIAVCTLARADTAQRDLAPAVKTLLAEWLKAQNDGDFASYEKLYAKRFTGVRRSGPRTVKLDRAGWMKDRQRMFAKKMTVSLADLKVRSAATLARVTFSQTWESGNYKDVGEKQLVVVREGEALKISSEEMLRSQIDQKDSNVAQPFVWVVQGAVVLSDSPDDAWAKGAPKMEAGSPTVVWRKADAKSLPPEIAGWLGKKVRAWNDKGQPACEANVVGFRVLGRVFEHFGTKQEWQEKGDKAAAEEAWELSGKLLVGELDGACKDALWARPAGLPVPEVGAFAEADAELRARAMAAFRKLAAYKLIQKEWLASDEGKTQKGPWEGDKPTVESVQTVLGGKPVTLVAVSHGAFESCAGFSAQLSAIWELRAGKLILRSDPGKTAIRPMIAVDSDGDGNAELLHQGSLNEFGSASGIWRFADGLFSDGEELRVPYLDCPC